MSQTLVKIGGGIIIVLMSFFATTYLLDWWSAPPASRTATTRAASTGQNLLWPSQDLANPRWARLGIAAIESNAAKSPDGNATAFHVVESNDNGRHFISINIEGVAPGKISTSSVYFKADDRDIRLETADRGKGKYGYALCNVGTNSVTKVGDIVGGSVDSVGDGWYRCWATMPYDLSTVVLNIELRSKGGISGYQGDGHSGVMLWGPQFETGDKPSAYMPTLKGPIANAN